MRAFQMTAWQTRAARWRALLTIAVASIALLVGPGTAWARQSMTATVQGVVCDPSDAAIPGATVTLRNMETGAYRQASTDENGSFQFPTVAAGRYQLTIVHDGFAQVHETLELTLDERWPTKIVLPIATQSQSLEVSADEPLIDPLKTALGRTITARELHDLPVPTGLFRDFTSLAALAPGVIADATSGTPIATAGQTGNDNTFMLDSLSVDSAISGGQTANIPLDAIKEFRVVSNHFSVEFGQASGAVVNVVTRSGANAPAGRAYYFQQEGAWNATSASARLLGIEDPSLNQATVGGFWGGPLVHNRAFIFGAAEQVAKNSVYVNSSPAALAFRPADPRSWPIQIHAPKVFVRGDINASRSNTLTLRYNFQSTTSSDTQREEFERRRAWPIRAQPDP